MIDIEKLAAERPCRHKCYKCGEQFSPGTHAAWQEKYEKARDVMKMMHEEHERTKAKHAALVEAMRPHYENQKHLCSQFHHDEDANDITAARAFVEAFEALTTETEKPNG